MTTFQLQGPTLTVIGQYVTSMQPYLFCIEQGNTFPTFEVNAYYQGVIVVPVSAKLRVWKDGSYTNLIDATMTINGNSMSYAWQTADTLNSGVYNLEVIVTDGSGNVIPIPVPNHYELLISDAEGSSIPNL